MSIRGRLSSSQFHPMKCGFVSLYRYWKWFIRFFGLCEVLCVWHTGIHCLGLLGYYHGSQKHKFSCHSCQNSITYFLLSTLLHVVTF